MNLILNLMLGAWLAFAQQPAPPAPKATEPPKKSEADDLREQLDELRQDTEEELESLRNQVDQMRREQTRSSSRRIPSIFNPAITAFGNFVGRKDDKKVLNESGDRIDDQFNLREVELDLRSSVDPWADAVMILSVGSDVPGEFSTEVEEGYVTIKKLPLLDSAPLGLRLKVGRFYADFGRFNHIHTHDLPQTTRPRSLTNVLGDGFAGEGVEAQMMLPTPGESNSLQASAALLDGGGLPVADVNSVHQPAFVEHLKWFLEPAYAHTVEIGLSSYTGKPGTGVTRTEQLYGLDLNYMWKPAVGGEWHSFLLGGELFYADTEVDTGPSRPLGFYVWSQYQFNPKVYLGARYDYTQSLADNSVETRTPSVWLTYYTTEFLRFRAGYEHSFSDDPDLDGLDTVLFEINWVYGSHPVEPYWVNR